jgi:hypothetical protein
MISGAAIQLVFDSQWELLIFIIYWWYRNNMAFFLLDVYGVFTRKPLDYFLFILKG